MWKKTPIFTFVVSSSSHDYALRRAQGERAYTIRSILLTIAAAWALTACGSDGNNNGSLNGGGSNSGSFVEPAYETDQATLDNAIICSGFENTDKPPVLLVHGTFTAGWEQYDWSYGPVLESMGFDVCTVTYPDRGLGDLQISAEYVANAIHYMHAQSGRKVAMIGHSQGALMPRWALKWWPSARDLVEDFVLQAGPNHGTSQGGTNPLFSVLQGITGIPAAFYQMGTDSEFEEALNADDETPGDVDYTSLYTQFDELVQPVTPVPTAALDWGMDNPRVSNILLQDVCPLLIVDHVTIGLTDTTTFLLTLDAILNDGPADIERAGGAATLCTAPAIVPGVTLPPTFLLDMAGLLPMEIDNGLLDPHLANEEPPLKPYAAGAVQ